ncbi:MAG: thioredoxin domain-containing protein, partial [Bryobacteraceae bacterium]
LRQHAHNPVNWLPWGETAFEKARREDKPIFLSVGYSTCHWCHVMAHESFEDESIAEVLNRDFVPVKLDREERPDVDRVYMLFVQASTGSGGWPMSVWLTPERKPFFGGTYFPPSSRYGRPGFREVLGQLARVWKEDRQRIEDSSNNVAEQLRSLAPRAQAAVAPDRELFASAYWPLRRSFDPKWGGFGGAPKFPRPVMLNYLLRYHALEGNPEALEMVTQTLDGMAAGGMHDQLGGGFHRYSVDERWFVPHFEKMLYDQAQLAISYLEAYQITGETRHAEVARGIFEYVRRDLTDAGGGFYSAEDADSADPENPSHHGEGAFYIWRKSEIDALLGSESAAFCTYFGVQPEGNVEVDPHAEFSGRNILFRAGTGDGREFESARASLLAARSKRPRPHLDNKILTSWNA